MRRLYLIFLPLYGFSQVWVQLSDFPGSERDDGVAAIVDHTAYFGTGLRSDWSLSREFFAYDLVYHSWSAIPDMPAGTARQYACSFSIGQQFYVFGGLNNDSTLQDLYRYTPATAQWIRLSSKPGPGLYAASILNFNNTVIVVGGRQTTSSPASAEVWEYNLASDKWSKKSDFPFDARYRASSAVAAGKGYLLFGIDSQSSFRKELYEYDPGTDSWSKLNDFPEPKGRAYAAMQAHNDRLVVFGGFDSLAQFKKDTWFYLTSGGQWIKGPDLPGMARRGDMSILHKGDLYISCGLGVGDTRLKETWRMDVPLGISENAGPYEVILFPNPSSGQLHLSCPAPFQYSVLDLQGQMLLNSQIQAGSFIVDLGTLQDGLYMVRMTTGNYNSTKLVVKRSY